MTFEKIVHITSWGPIIAILCRNTMDLCNGEKIKAALIMLLSGGDFITSKLESSIQIHSFLSKHDSIRC